jgi:hypothetical protein
MDGGEDSRAYLSQTTVRKLNEENSLYPAIKLHSIQTS